MSASHKSNCKIEELRKILSEDELEDPYFLSDGCLLNYLEEKRFNVIKAAKRHRETMAWRKERNLKELLLNNVPNLGEQMKLDRQGRPVFLHCPTIQSLNQIFGDEVGIDVDFRDIKTVQDVKTSLDQIEKTHAQSSTDSTDISDMFSKYKEDVIRAGVLYLEGILAAIKASDPYLCENERTGKDPKKPVSGRSAVIILDLAHYCIFTELAENIEDIKSVAWLYIPKLVTLYTQGYELIKNHYPGLVHEIYLLNVPKRVSRVMLFMAKPYIRADWLGKLKIFGRKRYKWHKALLKKIEPEVLQELFPDDLQE